MVLCIVDGPSIPPPETLAVLNASVLLKMVTALPAPSRLRPPPTPLTVLPLSVQLVMVAEPLYIEMPPPPPFGLFAVLATLPETAELLITRLPPVNRPMPPP